MFFHISQIGFYAYVREVFWTIQKKSYFANCNGNTVHITYNTELHDMAQYVDGGEDETFFSIIEIEKHHHSIRFATAEKSSRLSRPPRRNEDEGLPEAA